MTFKTEAFRAGSKHDFIYTAQSVFYMGKKYSLVVLLEDDCGAVLLPGPTRLH